MFRIIPVLWNSTLHLDLNEGADTVVGVCKWSYIYLEKKIFFVFQQQQKKLSTHTRTKNQVGWVHSKIVSHPLTSTIPVSGTYPKIYHNPNTIGEEGLSEYESHTERCSVQLEGEIPRGLDLSTRVSVLTFVLRFMIVYQIARAGSGSFRVSTSVILFVNLLFTL